MQFHLRSLCLAAMVVGLLVAGRQCDAAEQESETTSTPRTVAVQLNNGLTMTAAVDVRTNDQKLWLRFDRPSALLLRPVDWQQIASVQLDDQTMTLEEFRRSVTELESARTLPREVSPPPNVVQAAAPTALAIPNQAVVQSLAVQPANGPPPWFGRVRSLAVDARLGNWDEDAAYDGLILSVVTLTDAGLTVPARGTLTVELLAERRSRLSPPLNQRREAFQRIARWTRNVRPVGDGQLTFLLPFQAVNPDDDGAVDSVGMIRAELSVPGEGVFRARQIDVRLRPVHVFRQWP